MEENRILCQISHFRRSKGFRQGKIVPSIGAARPFYFVHSCVYYGNVFLKKVYIFLHFLLTKYIL